MRATSDAILRPRWLEFYEVCGAKEAFDVTCPPTSWDPVRRLGYLVFAVSPTAPGGLRWTEGFSSRALVFGRS